MSSQWIQTSTHILPRTWILCISQLNTGARRHCRRTTLTSQRLGRVHEPLFRDPYPRRSWILSSRWFAARQDRQCHQSKAITDTPRSYWLLHIQSLLSFLTFLPESPPACKECLCMRNGDLQKDFPMDHSLLTYVARLRMLLVLFFHSAAGDHRTRPSTTTVINRESHISTMHGLGDFLRFPFCNPDPSRIDSMVSVELCAPAAAPYLRPL